MTILKRIICFILKIIEEIIMKLIPSICGKNKINLPQFCADMPYFKGVTDETINQGTAFDLLEGVQAFDPNGNEIPFDVTPSEIESCEVGTQVFTYTTEGLSKDRTITVVEIANPTISGVPSTTLEVGVGDTFDPLDGVTAVDGNGNTVAVTVNLIPSN